MHGAKTKTVSAFSKDFVGRLEAMSLSDGLVDKKHLTAYLKKNMHFRTRLQTIWNFPHVDIPSLPPLTLASVVHYVLAVRVQLF